LSSIKEKRGLIEEPFKKRKNGINSEAKLKVPSKASLQNISNLNI